MQNTFSTASVSAEAAKAMIAAAVAKGDELGKRFTIAIVDGGGTLKAFHRMDGAALMSVQVAMDKAYTAAGFGRPSGKWDEVLEADEVLGRGARAGIDRLVTFAGGLPLIDAGIVGGIGVSGAHYSEDLEVATAAVEAAGFTVA
jgi:uncharacterized protein GlcG (DUF336 family)